MGDKLLGYFKWMGMILMIGDSLIACRVLLVSKVSCGSYV